MKRAAVWWIVDTVLVDPNASIGIALILFTSQVAGNIVGGFIFLLALLQLPLGVVEFPFGLDHRVALRCDGGVVLSVNLTGLEREKQEGVRGWMENHVFGLA